MSNTNFICEESRNREEVISAKRDLIAFLREKNSHLVAIRLFSNTGYCFNKDNYWFVDFKPIEIKVIQQQFAYRQRCIYEGHCYGIYSTTIKFPNNEFIIHCIGNIQYAIDACIRKQYSRRFAPSTNRISNKSTNVLTGTELENLLDEKGAISVVDIFDGDLKRPIHISYALIVQRGTIFLKIYDDDYLKITPEDVDSEKGLDIDPSIFSQE